MAIIVGNRKEAFVFFSETHKKIYSAIDPSSTDPALNGFDLLERVAIYKGITEEELLEKLEAQESVEVDLFKLQPPQQNTPA